MPTKIMTAATERKYTIENILKTEGKNFKPLIQPGLNLKHRTTETWIQKSIVNTDSVEKDMIIELVNPFLYGVTFYTTDSLTVTDSLIAGSGLPYSSRRINHPNFQYPLKLLPFQQLTCYIKIASGSAFSDLILLVWDKDKRKDYQPVETKYLSYFLLINAVFLLLIGLAVWQTKQPYQWYYFLYVLFGMAYIYTDLGLGFKNIWPAYPSFNNAAVFIYANGYLVFGLSFVRKYFETPKRVVFIDGVLKALIITGIICGIIDILLVFLIDILPYWLLVFNTIIFLTAGIMVFVTALYCYRFKYFKNDTLYFIIGFFPHAIAISFLCFKVFGWFNNGKEIWFEQITPIFIKTTYTPNFLLWSVLWELLIVFSLIIRRIKNIYETNSNLMVELSHQREKSMRNLLTDVEKERKRIAQELHDGSGARLATLKMKLNILKEELEDSSNPAIGISNLMHDVDKLHEEIRNISHNLMPKTLSKLGLYPAIDELVNQFKMAAPTTKINYFVKYRAPHFNEDAKINIYRIIQELLTNVVKHAQATEVTLQLIRHNDKLLISIEDDGVGFDIRNSRRGMGLNSIESRVRVLNGTFLADSHLGNGTFISVFLPVENIA
ncbi:MAG: 7TM-DISM domain-containing protein [Niabella sp.]